MLLYRLESICNKSDRVDVTRKIQFLPERENMGPRNQILDNRGFRIQRNIFTRLSTKDNRGFRIQRNIFTRLSTKDEISETNVQNLLSLMSIQI